MAAGAEAVARAGGMTEAEWERATDPQAMLTWLRDQGQLSERKARLFGLAVAQPLAPLLTDPRSRRILELMERVAEAIPGRDPSHPSLAWHAAVETVGAAVRSATALSSLNASMWAACAAYCPGLYAGPGVDGVVPGFTQALDAAELAACEHEAEEGAGTDPAAGDVATAGYVRLLHDLFGNPFRPVAFDPAWRTPTAVAIAQVAYDARDFAALPVLADALEEAGCDNAELLAHLRGPGPHARGCWAADLVLEKS
jgi:hypothetical protein